MDALQIAGTVTGVLGAVSGVGLALRWMHRRWRVVEHFLEDWRGEEARPGVAARPGVPERLAAIEAELRPNSGHSLRDAVTRIEASVEAHVRDPRAHETSPASPSAP